MFSGIVETMAQIVKIEQEQGNKHFTLRNPYAETLKIDQSIAHNGVCLTVVKMDDNLYTVTAMQETLNRTNLGEAKEGDWVNLEPKPNSAPMNKSLQRKKLKPVNPFAPKNTPVSVFFNFVLTSS